MKAVKVEYKVKPEFAEQNQANIKKVMEVLKANPIEGLQYSSFMLDDGQTFVHFNMCKDAETMAKLNDVKEFTAFRKALKDSEPIVSPEGETLNMVGASFQL